MRRLTFKFIVAQAAKFGVAVERTGKRIDYWICGEDHTVGTSYSVSEAWDDLNANFFKI